MASADLWLEVNIQWSSAVKAGNDVDAVPFGTRCGVKRHSDHWTAGRNLADTSLILIIVDGGTTAWIGTSSHVHASQPRLVCACEL